MPSPVTLTVMDTKAKEGHQFQGEFMRSVQVTVRKCVCNFALVMTCESYTLADFVKDLVTLSRIFTT